MASRSLFLDQIKFKVKDPLNFSTERDFSIYAILFSWVTKLCLGLGFSMARPIFIFSVHICLEALATQILSCLVPFSFHPMPNRIIENHSADAGIEPSLPAQQGSTLSTLPAPLRHLKNQFIKRTSIQLLEILFGDPWRDWTGLGETRRDSTLTSISPGQPR